MASLKNFLLYSAVVYCVLQHSFGQDASVPATEVPPAVKYDNGSSVAPSTTVAPSDNTTTTTAPDVTTTTTAPENITTTSSAPDTTTSTTAAPTTSAPNDTTTTEVPTTKTPDVPTTTPGTTTSTEAPATSTAGPVPVPSGGFSAGSFFGGAFLTLALLAVGFGGYKFYKTRYDVNYRTL